MSIVKGGDALTSNENVNNGGTSEEHVLRYLKADESIRVRLLSSEEIAKVEVYDIYPLTGTIGVPDGFNHFKTASEELFKKADELKEALGYKKDDKIRDILSEADYKTFIAGKGKEWYDTLKEAYRLTTEHRFLFGFIDLVTGNPFVMQATKKQAPKIHEKIKKLQPQKDAFAFRVSKATGGFDIEVDFDPLTPDESTIVERTKTFEIPVETYGEAHFKPNEDFQLDVLKKFGFDMPKLGAKTSETTQEDTVSEVTHEDLPF
ncbi:hypothetical protein COE80_19430 [Bacillus pseudomycoides]|uniref:hypothetical protein n=1 Tax=Bacillus pseudomycoides TaxID=64104 RepID=UPI000BFC6DD3|nr:hypothetical protein [Bacillus pseudomycoides]PHB23086.1 hypothetical protein COE80_19430 [Bacillus pseudomycoides]PHE37615.1 hypothetical protein COF51_16395 [Bacillus pseudomycoides]